MGVKEGKGQGRMRGEKGGGEGKIRKVYKELTKFCEVWSLHKEGGKITVGDGVNLVKLTRKVIN